MHAFFGLIAEKERTDGHWGSGRVEAKRPF